MEAVNIYRGLNLNANSLYLFYKAGRDSFENKKMNKLESRIRVIRGEGGEYSSFLTSLKETNPNAYKNLNKMIRVAYRKARREKKDS